MKEQLVKLVQGGMGGWGPLVKNSQLDENYVSRKDQGKAL